MDIDQRIRAFLQLGKKVGSLSADQRDGIYQKAMWANPWFTYEHLDLAFSGLARYLSESDLLQWLEKYDLSPASIRTVGVVMAGNIPMVGLHDFICVLLSGHRINIKLSSNDDVLIPYLADMLIAAEARFADLIRFSERLTTYDAVIATGSDNASRYFRYYFAHVPHIIRKNRTSVAILTGDENVAELDGLARDVHEYFGMGCRNVSKIMIPADYDIRALVPHMQNFAHFMQHNKYANNYDYQKAILTMNRIPFVDTGAGLLVEHDRLVSPVAVTYYGHYRNDGELLEYLEANREKIQCIVAAHGLVEGSVPYGQAQRPGMRDYADGVDTLAFLTQL